jgi:Tol biopolymer transport system component
MLDAEGQPALIMELLEGENLADRLARGPVPLPDVITIGLQVASALDAAHQKGILHRDIKPGNIFILPSGQIKVLDFGLAKSTLSPDVQETLSLSSSPMTSPGAIVGTILYVAPEQALGERVDGRTDIFTLGVVMYQLCTGRLPFTGKTLAAHFDALLHVPPVPVQAHNPKVSPKLAAIVTRALERRPENRQQTAAELERELRELQWRPDAGWKPTLRARWAMATALLTIAIAIATLVIFARLPKSPAVALTVSQATDSLGEELFPSMAPDGKSFVFAARQHGTWDIFSRRLDDRRTVNLTADYSGDDTQPSFSFDGNRLAFRSERQGGGIFIMSATGESVRRVADFGYNPSWSSDGKFLVVATEGVTDPINRGRASQLWTLETDTGKKRLIYAEDAVQPSWSPHGDRIAFWSGLSGHREVKTISAGGGEARSAATEAEVSWNPVWSPDGRFLYYLSNQGGSMNVWRAAINERTGSVAQKAEPVTTPATEAAHLSLARNARRGVYVQRFSAANLHKSKFDGNRTTGEPVSITHGTRMLVSPDVSQDGEWIVYGTFGTPEDIYVVRMDGTDSRQLTNDTYMDRRPRWSPDGKRIVFDSNRTGRFELWQINSDGTALTQLTHASGRGIMQGVWSPAGDELAFSRPEGVPGIFKLSSSTMKELDVLANPKNWNGITSWSPDGAHLAFHIISSSQGPHGVGIYSIRSGEATRLREEGTSPTWMPDSRHLLYENGTELHLLDTITRADRIIMRTAPYELELGSRSGGVRDWIFYSLISREADIWSFELQ